MTKIASNLQIDSARLWGTIHETAKFGATPKGGVRRLTLGPEDKQVRDWFRRACEAAGLEVHVDALGSMFGVRKGRDMSKPPVGLGSTVSMNGAPLALRRYSSGRGPDGWRRGSTRHHWSAITSKWQRTTSTTSATNSSSASPPGASLPSSANMAGTPR